MVRNLSFNILRIKIILPQTLHEYQMKTESKSFLLPFCTMIRSYRSEKILIRTESAKEVF